jgi:hypothetical protein
MIEVGTNVLVRKAEVEVKKQELVSNAKCLTPDHYISGSKRQIVAN